MAYSRMSPPEYEKALEDYTRAIELSPNLEQAYFNRGRLFQEKPEPDLHSGDIGLRPSLSL